MKLVQTLFFGDRCDCEEKASLTLCPPEKEKEEIVAVAVAKDNDDDGDSDDLKKAKEVIETFSTAENIKKLLRNEIND
jgi:hypothetical protein